MPFSLLTSKSVNPSLIQATPTTFDVEPITRDASNKADTKTAFEKVDYLTDEILPMQLDPLFPLLWVTGNGY